MKRKPKKSKWAKCVDRDKAYNMGKIVGMRNTLEILAEESALEPTFTAWLFEEWIMEKHKKEFNEK